MTIMPLVPRAQACMDVDQAVEHYVSEAGTDVAIAFIDALEQAYALIGSTPMAGSTRWSRELNLPGLRTMRLKQFPWLVFYVDRESHVDVWHVLHAKRDIAAWLTDAAAD